MFRPDHEYQCLLGIYEPLVQRFNPDYKYNYSFERVASLAGDQDGCIGCTGIVDVRDGAKAILVARPFRDGGEVIVSHLVNGSVVTSAYQLYDSQLETPRLIWLPDDSLDVGINIRVEDMGYEPSWYNPTYQIQDECDKDFINGLGIYFMYDAKPCYSKLELVKEPDSQAPSGRFLRDKLTTDLSFRATDYDRLVAATEYAVCAVAFYERFEENPSQDYMAACCYFNRADAEVSFSECYVKPNLKALDNYSWLLDKYSAEKNIVGIQATTQEVSIPIPPVVQLYIMGSNAVTNICNDTAWEQEVSDPDMSLSELTKLGFFKLTKAQVESEMPNYVEENETHVLNLYRTNIWDTVRLVQYLYNEVSGEYSYSGTTDNMDNYPPSDSLPYDFIRFRYVDGKIEGYNSETGSVMGSCLYSGNWPCGANDLHARRFMTMDGDYWDLASGQSDGNIPILVRVLYHSEEGSDARKIGDFASLTKWYNKLPDIQFYYSFLNITGGWVNNCLLLKETNKHIERPTEYGNYQPDLYYTNEDLPTDSYLRGLKPLPFGKSWWGDYSYWVDLRGSNIESLLNGLTTKVVIKDCYTLDSVIRRLLNKYGLAFDFTATYKNSMLLYSKGVTNYLKCLYCHIVPATNITRGRYTQAAQKSMLSLKDLLDEICTMCNAGWHIDKDGLHIEGNEWYDAGHSYNGVNYSPNFDFESVVDEFNGTNTLYGQIVSSPDVDNLWHTLSMGDDDTATKHFANTEMTAKALFCKKDSSVSPKFAYDLLKAVAVQDSIDEDNVIMLGVDNVMNITGEGVTHTIRLVSLASTYTVNATTTAVSGQVQAMVMNKAFSWPYLKGRHMFGLPADKSLIDFGWLQIAEYYSTLPKAYTKPHRTMKIRMPIVSSLYTENWQLAKTTLGYGVISRVDIDLITRVATMTVDILEYNLQ